MINFITAREARDIADYDGDVSNELEQLSDLIKWAAAEKRLEASIDGSLSNNVTIILRANGFSVHASYEDDGSTIVSWKDRSDG